jgi:hypothetical protein
MMISKRKKKKKSWAVSDLFFRKNKPFQDGPRGGHPIYHPVTTFLTNAFYRFNELETIIEGERQKREKNATMKLGTFVRNPLNNLILYLPSVGQRQGQNVLPQNRNTYKKTTAFIPFWQDWFQKSLTSFQTIKKGEHQKTEKMRQRSSGPRPIVSPRRAAIHKTERHYSYYTCFFFVFFFASLSLFVPSQRESLINRHLRHLVIQ